MKQGTLVNMVNRRIQFVQVAQNDSIFKVEVTCAENGYEFSFDDYADALTEALSWYYSGCAEKISIKDLDGKVIITFCRSIIDCKKLINVSG